MTTKTVQTQVQDDHLERIVQDALSKVRHASSRMAE